jgi:hypothetical protein
LTDPREIRREIESGLPNERERLDRAMIGLEFYQGNFRLAPVRPQGFSGDRSRWPRYSLLMQQCVKTLTKLLYKQGPGRTLKDQDAATDWLNNVYRVNCIDALWQEADRMSVVSEVAAFQVVPYPDPDKPIKVRLWDASSFTVWASPDDPLEPYAVAILDKFDNQRRLRLWTDDSVSTFVTPKYNGQTSGATAYRFVEEKSNDLGFLPFCFVHFDFPICDFWTPSPGHVLQQINDGVNKQITDAFDRNRYNLNPIVVLSGVRGDWRPPSPAQPGDVWYLPSGGDTASEDGGDANAEYLQADSSFIAATWEDLDAFLGHTLEMLGIPPAAIRMEQSSARSGVSIAAEQIALVDWATCRQRPFAYYEDELAKLVLKVGTVHLGSQLHQEYVATAADLEVAYHNPQLTLRWPDFNPKLPGEERDRHWQFLIDNALTSRKRILMEEQNLTDEEAEAVQVEIMEELKWEQEQLQAMSPQTQQFGADGQPIEEGEDDVPVQGEEDEEAAEEEG